VRIGCKIHPKMRSYIANIPSDNFNSFEFEKKQTKTSFKLEKIAASTESFVLLLAGMDVTKINLAKGETKTFEILKKGKKNGSLTLTRS
jgi:hypothetical protein